MRYVVIGASGLVGANMLAFLQQQAQEAVGTHLSFPAPSTHYLDLNNPDHPQNFSVAAYEPDVIIHTGALTNVDYCELHPEESYTRTVTSTLNALQLCKTVGARLVFISTDYVFDGHDGPYREDTVPNPLNVYGRHKLEAEELIRADNAGHLIVRVTNVYGDELRGKNFIARLADLMTRNETSSFRLPTDQFATPVNAMDVARAVYELLKFNRNGTYHLGSTDYFSRAQLFQKVLDYFPDYKNYTVELLPTAILKQPAARPLFGGLLAAKFIAEYPEFRFTNVDDYLRSRYTSSQHSALFIS